MICGIDFPSFFDKDNFTLRRTTGHNMHDPESFITGAELEKGFTYTNSRRNWANYRHYVAAVAGMLTPEEIAKTAPRVCLLRTCTPFLQELSLAISVEEAGAL